MVSSLPDESQALAALAHDAIMAEVTGLCCCCVCLHGLLLLAMALSGRSMSGAHDTHAGLCREHACGSTAEVHACIERLFPSKICREAGVAIQPCNALLWTCA